MSEESDSQSTIIARMAVPTLVKNGHNSIFLLSVLRYPFIVRCCMDSAIESLAIPSI